VTQLNSKCCDYCWKCIVGSAKSEQKRQCDESDTFTGTLLLCLDVNIYYQHVGYLTMLSVCSKLLSLESDSEKVVAYFHDQWNKLREQAIDQDLTVISLVVAVMLLLHCIAHSK